MLSYVYIKWGNMMKKKVVNRYTLVSLEETVEVHFRNKYTLYEIRKEISENNKNNKSKYFLGDLIVDEPNKTIRYKKYKKLASPSTLEKIDKLTTSFEDEKTLLKHINSNLNLNKIISPMIVYRANGQIRFLKVIYKEYENYINKKEALSKFIKVGDEIEFLNSVLKNKQIISHTRNCINELDNLYVYRDNLKYSEYKVSKEPLTSFYYAFIYDEGHFNYFKFRLLMSAVINYEEWWKELLDELGELEKEAEVLEEIVSSPKELKQETEMEQLILPEFQRDLMRSQLEEEKIAITQGKKYIKKL